MHHLSQTEYLVAPTCQVADTGVMILIMKFGDRTVDFLCFDKEESQHVSREILIGKTYPPVSFARL